MSEKAETKAPSLQVVLWLLVAVLLCAAIWGNSYFASEVPALYRALGVTVLGVVSAFIALQTVKGKAFNQFRKDAMVELRKVVWPTRQEAVQTTIIVVVFVFAVGLILFFFDWILNGIVSRIIG